MARRLDFQCKTGDRGSNRADPPKTTAHQKIFLKNDALDFNNDNDACRLFCGLAMVLNPDLWSLPQMEEEAFEFLQDQSISNVANFSRPDNRRRSIGSVDAIDAPREIAANKWAYVSARGLKATKLSL